MPNALWRWKAAHNLTYAQLAAALGLRISQAKKLGAGLIPCSVQQARQIEQLSNGEIKAEELVFPERFQNGKRKRGVA